jgi:hypothetical protein
MNKYMALLMLTSLPGMAADVVINWRPIFCAFVYHHISTG